MELAAMFSFAILVVAWILAPDRPRMPRPMEAAVSDSQAEAQPLAA